eukprot:6901676-Prymnesium_polylepis.2
MRWPVVVMTNVPCLTRSMPYTLPACVPRAVWRPRESLRPATCASHLPLPPSAPRPASALRYAPISRGAPQVTHAFPHIFHTAGSAPTLKSSDGGRLNFDALAAKNSPQPRGWRTDRE